MVSYDFLNYLDQNQPELLVNSKFIIVVSQWDKNPNPNLNVESFIRDMLVSESVSEVSTIKEVREFAVAQQQQMGNKKGIVMDGRDIGTTVFPDAELKIFVTADVAVRVARRYQELFAKDANITLEEVQQNLEMRDYIDSNREVSPLKKANDAIVLDNSNITRDEQLSIALEWVDEKLKD